MVEVCDFNSIFMDLKFPIYRIAVTNCDDRY